MAVTKKDYQGLRYVDYPLWLTCCHYSAEETAGLHSSCFYAFTENCTWLYWPKQFLEISFAEVLRRRPNKQVVVETREKASQETSGHTF